MWKKKEEEEEAVKKTGEERREGVLKAAASRSSAAFMAEKVVNSNVMWRGKPAVAFLSSEAVFSMYEAQYLQL